MAIALVGTITAAQADDNPQTPNGYNTAGANLLVAVVVDHSSGGGGTPGDNKSNTGWVTLAIPTLANSSRTRICYHTNTPNVGADHRFTFTGTGVYSTVIFAAFSGAHQTAPFPTGYQSGNSTGSSTTISAGTVLADAAGWLFVAGLGLDVADNGIAISGIFAAPVGFEQNGTPRGGYLSYAVTATSGTHNPVWTSTDANAMTAVLASFAPSGASIGSGVASSSGTGAAIGTADGGSSNPVLFYRLRR